MDITVVIPCYNCHNTIKQTLESIESQIDLVSEILIVDDGSKNPVKIPDSIRNEKIKLIRKENGGVSSARNYGIKMAGSEYIAFLDADDLWAPNKLEHQIDYLKTYKHIEWCFCNYESEHNRYTQVPKKAKKVLDEVGYYENYTDMTLWGVPHQTSGLIVKKSLLIKAGLYDEELNAAEDLDLYFRMSMISNKVGYINKILYIYQEDIPHSQVKSNTRATDAIKSLIKLGSTVVPAANPHAFNRDAFKRYLENSIYRALLHYYAGKQILDDVTVKEALGILKNNRALFVGISLFRLMPVSIGKKLDGYLRDLNRQLLYFTHK